MNIVALGQYSPSVLNELGKYHDVTCIPGPNPNSEVFQHAEILITRGHVTVSGEFLSHFPKLKLIIKAGSGLDNIDVKFAQASGIQVETTPASTYSVAELVITLLLSLRRNICLMDDEVRQGNWKIKYEKPGHQLRGSTLGLIGYGRIAREVAKIASCMGMEILAYDRTPENSVKQIVAYSTNTVFTDLNHLLSDSNAISIHTPLTEDTRGLIGLKEISLLQMGSVIINTGRAEIIDKNALIQALNEGKIAGAGLDVFYEEPVHPNDPLLQFNNIICTPHIGAQTIEAMDAIGNMVVEKVKTYSKSHIFGGMQNA